MELNPTRCYLSTSCHSSVFRRPTLLPDLNAYVLCRCPKPTFYPNICHRPPDTLRRPAPEALHWRPPSPLTSIIGIPEPLPGFWQLYYWIEAKFVFIPEWCYWNLWVKWSGKVCRVWVFLVILKKEEKTSQNINILSRNTCFKNIIHFFDVYAHE